ARIAREDLRRILPRSRQRGERHGWQWTWPGDQPAHRAPARWRRHPFRRRRRRIRLYTLVGAFDLALISAAGPFIELWRREDRTTRESCARPLLMGTRRASGRRRNSRR